MMDGTKLNEALKRQLDADAYQALAAAVAAKVRAADAAGYARARAENPWPALAADTLRGLARSWTGRIGALLIAMPEILPAIQSDLPGLLGENAANRVMQIAGLLMLLLRIKSKVPVWERQ